MAPRIIVCGIGNTLLQDEGIGVHVVRELSRAPLPPSVEVLEVGTMLLDYIAQLREADQLILIDAMRGDGPPGSVYILSAPELIRGPTDHPLSLHQVGVEEVLRIMALEGSPPPCLIVGIEPASLGWGLEPSPLLKGRMEGILKILQGEIQKCLQERNGGPALGPNLP